MIKLLGQIPVDVRYKMVNTNLTEYWQETISEIVSRATGGKRKHIECQDFNCQVWLTTDWGTTYNFHGALFFKSKKRNELVVLTEHDGYFLFPTEHVRYFSMKRTGESQLGNFINKEVSGILND